MSVALVLGAALASGVAGWAIENALFAPRYSRVFGEARIPFLPVFAAGGAAVALLSEEIADESPIVRGAVYAAVLTGLEGAAGLADRSIGRTSWDYDGAVVDVPHALAWGALGLGLDETLRRIR